MKQKIHFRVVMGAVGGLALCLAPSAFGQNTGFYVKAGIGPAFTEDTRLKEFDGPVAPDTKVKFDPGFQFRVAGGYHITPFLATELETGVTYNTIRSITGADEADGSLANAPVLANLVLQCPRTHQFVPYIGGGLGVSSSVLDAHDLALNGAVLRGTQSEAVFAYHGFAGVRYNINGHMGVSLDYRYFGTTAPTWEADIVSGPGTGKTRFGDNHTHSVTVAFSYHF